MTTAAATTTQNQWRRGQNAATMMSVSDSLGMPVVEG